jgi:hypothetical protein
MMKQIYHAENECKGHSAPLSVAGDGEAFRDYLLIAIRCACLRVQLSQNEMESVGVALRGRLVAPEIALEWLGEIGAIQFVDIGEVSQ